MSDGSARTSGLLCSERITGSVRQKTLTRIWCQKPSNRRGIVSPSEKHEARFRIDSFTCKSPWVSQWLTKNWLFTKCRNIDSVSEGRCVFGLISTAIFPLWSCIGQYVVPSIYHISAKLSAPSKTNYSKVLDGSAGIDDNQPHDC